MGLLLLESMPCEDFHNHDHKFQPRKISETPPLPFQSHFTKRGTVKTEQSPWENVVVAILAARKRDDQPLVRGKHLQGENRKFRGRIGNTVEGLLHRTGMMASFADASKPKRDPGDQLYPGLMECVCRHFKTPG
jgi:hypothetical protein